MKTFETTIHNLSKLAAQKTLSIEAMDEWSSQSNHIQLYLQTMKLAVKPEAATSDLFRNIIALENVHLYPEMRQGERGNVDFVVQETRKNPVLIELKSLFVHKKNKAGDIVGIKYNPLNYQKHQDQVRKYLEKNDYLILTNLAEAYLFNRDVLYGDFQPYHSLSFAELLQEYHDTKQSFWDLLHRFDEGLGRIILENCFFEDLSRWYNSLQTINFIEKEGFQKEELIVLLLNKIIFIKTLEDYGLVRFNKLADAYTYYYEEWIYKGILEIFQHFFAEIEDWFWKYYDTELFSTQIWSFIDKSPANLDKFRRVFEKILGIGIWDRAFGKGMIHYDYRKIDEDVFGKAYETFIAKQKKDTGIYYTHHLITQYMVEQLVTALFTDKIEAVITALENNDVATARQKITTVQQIKIADTCSGSGSFLIKVLREVYAQYRKIEEKTRYVKAFNGQDLFDKPPHIKAVEQFRLSYHFDNERQLLSSIILHHIFAIDIDERALDTAKTNMWKEAVKLNPRVFNFRLIPENMNHTLPNLALNFINGDTLYDLPLEWQLQFLQENFIAEMKQLHTIRCDYLLNLHNPQILIEVAALKAKMRESMLVAVNDDLFNDLLNQHKPILIGIEFFYLYFDEQGNVLPEKQRGFDGIVSNPPWEVLKPIKKEFAGIGKGQMDKKQFDVWFKKKCQEDKPFSEDWQAYQSFYDKYRIYLRANYQYQGEGDLNYFKLLVERDFNLVKTTGYVNLLIPSSIQTDLGCTELRKLLIQKNTLCGLYSFENRGYETENSDKKTKIFPDVHPQFKFSIVQTQKTHCAEEYDFKGLFYLHHPQTLYSKQPITINSKLIEKFSPDSFSIMEFSNQIDFNLCQKILGNHTLLKDLNYAFRREFHMTGDADYFNTQKKTDDWILYEGKMIHQFNSNFSLPNYFVEPALALEILLEKEIKRIKKDLNVTKKVEELKAFFQEQGYLLDCQTYRLIYRSVGSSTNERTLISSIIPNNVFSVNSVNYLINCSYEQNGDYFIQKRLSHFDVVFLMSVLNSLTLNYYIRNKISANLNMFYLYELPIAKPKLKKELIEKGFTLLYAKSKSELYEDLRQTLNLAPINTEELDLIQIRAELEVLIAKLYGLNAKDWDYLTSTFVYGAKSETKKELDAIIEHSREIF
ncbi:N-6 DNA methylase [Candidatus Parabeggiatoa sp. HSG14]|uniref:Eco57I restriction-modification methylase domain-containing protein n=1 Tax=Candidatus Parabeggiatoa sp. HSG14 TaxID=3055593 RepID=UPI0025A77D5C|nr:N-6 DNA methylase [Thiotrichales bacterium HSG14]